MMGGNIMCYHKQYLPTLMHSGSTAVAAVEVVLCDDAVANCYHYAQCLKIVKNVSICHFSTTVHYINWFYIDSVSAYLL